MDSDEIFTVERILGHRFPAKGKRHFLVKWLNYEIETSTWEPEENLFCRRLIDEYWKNPRPNISLKKIVEEEMEKQFKSVSRTKDEDEVEVEEVEEIEETSSEDVSSDETDDMLEQEARRHREFLEKKPQEEFNFRAFVKLGLTVSALIVIAFILWNGNDHYYMNQFSAQFDEQRPRHQEH